jgi:hypothetical protein
MEQKVIDTKFLWLGDQLYLVRVPVPAERRERGSRSRRAGREDEKGDGRGGGRKRG